MRIGLGLAIASLLALSGCEAKQSSPKAEAPDKQQLAKFEHAAKLAGLFPPLPSHVLEGTVTAADPVDGAVSLRAWSSDLWDSADGSYGSITLTSNTSAKPDTGSRAGLAFEAKAGRIYLVHCAFADYKSPTMIDAYFSGGVAGHKQEATNTNEFSVAAGPATADAPARFEFAVDQEDRRVVGCEIYSLGA